jgi:hypothetical protein
MCEGGESTRACGGDGVIDTAAAVDGFAPRAKRTVIFECMQDGVDDAFADGDDFCGAVADGLNDLVAVHFLILKEAEDEQFRDAIHEVRIGFAGGHWRDDTLEFKVLQE